MPVDDASLTVDEFCEAEKISRTSLLALWREGRGPRFFRVGVKKRISHEARMEWRRGLEAETQAAAIEN